MQELSRKTKLRSLLYNTLKFACKSNLCNIKNSQSLLRKFVYVQGTFPLEYCICPSFVLKALLFHGPFLSNLSSLYSLSLRYLGPLMTRATPLICIETFCADTKRLNACIPNLSTCNCGVLTAEPVPIAPHGRSDSTCAAVQPCKTSSIILLVPLVVLSTFELSIGFKEVNEINSKTDDEDLSSVCFCLEFKTFKAFVTYPVFS